MSHATTLDRPPDARPPDEAAAGGQTTVSACYSILDRFFRNCELFDFTEGIYDQPGLTYEQAQRRQADYLLDEIGCGPGTRVLDVGCGAGTLLERVRQRGGLGTGITISREQVMQCRAKELDVRLQDYRILGEQWTGRFDAIVANGSIEHFVQPTEAARGEADAIYHRMFSIFQRLIDPATRQGRVATTVIHFVRVPRPEQLMARPWSMRWGSDEFHYALLAQSFGGFYPVEGQLRRAAEPHFDEVRAVDGTLDYHTTSEEWLRRVRSKLRSRRFWTIARQSLPLALRWPNQFAKLVCAALVAESWTWQFRPPDPPTRLWRQTFQIRRSGAPKAAARFAPRTPR